jgi:DNA-directed RNA polymerase specialized sigma24 family protein
MSFVPDSPTGKQNGASPSDSAPDATPKPKWEPTAETLAKFLALLSDDSEEAGKEYEKLRKNLIRFFEWRGCGSADILADQTFDRVLRKIDEGETITNPKAYVRKVGYYIYLEYDPTLMSDLDDDFTLAAPDNSDDDFDKEEVRFNCLDKCLAELPPESKNLILTYYQNEKRAKKDGRRELAEQLSIPMNALRIRAHRIRKSLEECIQKCMAP